LLDEVELQLHYLDLLVQLHKKLTGRTSVGLKYGILKRQINALVQMKSNL